MIKQVMFHNAKYLSRPSVLSLLIFLLGVSFPTDLTALEISDKWPSQKGDHFILYSEDGDLSYAGEFLHRAERFFERITDTLGYFDRNSWLWENRCPIYVYRNRDSYVKKSGQPAWSGAASIHYPKRMLLAYRGSEALLDGDLPHEITHLVLHAYMGLQNPNLPSWLDEGLAAWHEEGKRVPYYKGAFKNASDFSNLISLSALSRVTEDTFHTSLFSKRNSVSYYYVESYSLVNFLIENYGPPRFADFLKLLKDGSTLNEALAKTYGHAFQDIYGLEQAWRNFLVASMEGESSTKNEGVSVF